MFDILNKKEKRERKPGDVQICFDGKNNPVIVPWQDRIMHTLITGPTGAGKLSFSFMPMIHQDIQNKDCGVTIFETDYAISDKAYAMAKYYGRNVVYFNPIVPMCPHFNPMIGEEENVIENILGAFREFNPNGDSYFLDVQQILLKYSIIILKRLFRDDVSLNLTHLSQLINDTYGYGTYAIDLFSKITVSTDEQLQEHREIISWFKDEYFNENSRMYSDCVAVRSQLEQLTSNKYLKDVLNPSREDKIIDFKKHIEDGDIVIISTNIGMLRDIGRLLGFMLMFEYQCAVFHRVRDCENMYDLKLNSIYINEFPVFCNRGFIDVLTQGRSYRVITQIGIQSIGTLPKEYKDIILTNSRNLIIYPGISKVDAEYFADRLNDVSKAVKFSPDELIYRKFGQVSYLHTYMNNSEYVGYGTVDFIPKEIDETLNLMCGILYDCIRGYNK